eukprot:scaffold242903_cov21-Prasinocladus_malaysianus.AAC.1
MADESTDTYVDNMDPSSLLALPEQKQNWSVALKMRANVPSASGIAGPGGRRGVSSDQIQNCSFDYRRTAEVRKVAGCERLDTTEITVK